MASGAGGWEAGAEVRNQAVREGKLCTDDPVCRDFSGLIRPAVPAAAAAHQAP